MNKTELIAAVASKCSISKKEAEAVVLATFDSITNALVSGEKVPRFQGRQGSQGSSQLNLTYPY